MSAHSYLNHKSPSQLKCANYRAYNVAYFEEVLIHYMAESRVAQNYRERFLTTPKALNLVLEMYCKNDYIAHFQNINLEDISISQLLDMFYICVLRDSFKIAINLYLKYLDRRRIDKRIMDAFILSLKKSVEFHEIKMFFILQHFDLLNITQMSDLVDILN